MIEYNIYLFFEYCNISLCQNNPLIPRPCFFHPFHSRISSSDMDRASSLHPFTNSILLLTFPCTYNVKEKKITSISRQLESKFPIFLSFTICKASFDAWSIPQRHRTAEGLLAGKRGWKTRSIRGGPVARGGCLQPREEEEEDSRISQRTASLPIDKNLSLNLSRRV